MGDKSLGAAYAFEIPSGPKTPNKEGTSETTIQFKGERFLSGSTLVVF